MYEIKLTETYYTTKRLIHTQRFEEYEKKNTNQEFPLHDLIFHTTYTRIDI